MRRQCVCCRRMGRGLVPKRRDACGACQHSRIPHEARRLARININAMSTDRLRRSCPNQPVCGSTMKEYGRLLAAMPRIPPKANYFAAKVRDVHEYLVALGPKTPPQLERKSLPRPRATSLTDSRFARRHENCTADRSGVIEMQHSDSVAG